MKILPEAGWAADEKWAGKLISCLLYHKQAGRHWLAAKPSLLLGKRRRVARLNPHLGDRRWKAGNLKPAFPAPSHHEKKERKA